MKTKHIVFAVFILLIFLYPLSAQKAAELRNGFMIGLSYHGSVFYEEDSVVNTNKLEDGEFNDGLFGVNLQYHRLFNSFLGIAVDYKFFIDNFDRGFRDYQQFDLVLGHQIFAGPVFQIGKGFFNVMLRPQLGYDYLKIAGEGDWETSSSGGYIRIHYVGSDPMGSMWAKMLTDYSSDTTTVIKGYPAYLRRGLIYQLGTNFNLSWEKVSLTLFIHFTSMKYNGSFHTELGMGAGTIFHF